jgi:exonuclease III
MFRSPETAYLPLNVLSDGLVIHPEDTFRTQKLQEHSRTASTKTINTSNRNMNQGMMKLAVWNVRGIYSKQQLEKELTRADVDFAIVPETKKKLKDTQELKDYILFYIGVERSQRAAAGIAITVKKKWKHRIGSYSFINERILQIRYKTIRYMSIVGVYAPGEGKTEETEQFFDELQMIIDKINKNDYLIVAGDLNARVGNAQIYGSFGNKWRNDTE